MSGEARALPPVRVERALGLLPDLEVLAPLRALLVSISRPDERTMWSSSGPYLTLGKRGVQPDELRRRLPPLFHRIAGHVAALYNAYAEALECQQRGDGGGAAAARDDRAWAGCNAAWPPSRASRETSPRRTPTSGGPETWSSRPARRTKWRRC